MFEKLKALEDRYQELTEKLGLPATLADPKAYQKVAKAHSEIEAIVLCYRKYRKIENDIEETTALRDSGEDKEIRALAEEELARLEAEKARVEQELNGLLVTLDATDQKNAILEIRAGTGGEEASLFAQEIYRMYMHYADRRGWKVEHLSSNRTGLGGFKEVILSVEGSGAYGTLKFESGVHRVQRVPETEGSGRVHTSAVTVAVLPEAEEVEVHIDEDKELRVDRFCSSGPGGQSVNTTYSAVRITHLPTGLVVQCQDEKSWHKNKAKALKVLRSRLYEIALREQQSEIAKQRRAMVGTGDRSEKIRTYNFPQNRVTDHRISLSIHRLGEILNGDLDEFINALRTKYQSEKLDEQIEAI